MRSAAVSTLIAVSFAALLSHAEVTAPVSVRVEPAQPILERGRHQQLLNFDFALINNGAVPLRITQIQVSVYDSAHRLVLRRSINSNGLSPGIALIGSQLLEPLSDSGALADAPALNSQAIAAPTPAPPITDIFNPFYSFAADLPLDELEYAFSFDREATPVEAAANQHRLPDDTDSTVTIAVHPRHYEDSTNLILPLHSSAAGDRLLIWDGHDFYSHHRRVPIDSAKARAMGITANSNRYALDFDFVDHAGNLYHGDPSDLHNWYSYGAPLFSPGAGTVVAAANAVPDNRFVGKSIVPPELPAESDPKGLGNFVLIEHKAGAGTGEYSLLLHMQPGSVTVRAGDRVHQGEQIGRIGFSRDSLFPHLHFSFLSGPEVGHSEGIPAYFHRFRRVLGNQSVSADPGSMDSESIDSGDIIESSAGYGPERTRKNAADLPAAEK